MITRIVRMTFKPEELETFMKVFGQAKKKIRAFEGVNELRLLRDDKFRNVLYTYSMWDNAEALQKYRKSDLFKSVWSQTRVLFADKPQAWSLRQLMEVE